jgi:hypothetical protein
MALQLRRGTSGTRTGIVPAAGELIYTTDTKLVYVGDGSTAGGTAVSSGGLTDIVNDTTPQLGGNLDVNGRSIVSASNGNIVIAPNGTGTIVLDGNITKTGELNITPTTLLSVGRNSDLINGNVYITRNSYNSAVAQGFTFAQHHNTVDAVNFTFYRTRGTGTSPTAVLNGDDVADINFLGWDGSNIAPGASIGAVVEGVPSTGNIPTKITFVTNNGAATAIRAELSSLGTWKTNTITALTTNQNLGIAANGTGSVGLDGILFKASTMTMPPQNAQPTGVAGKMAVCDGTSWNGGGDSLQHLMIYINSAWTVVV